MHIQVVFRAASTVSYFCLGLVVESGITACLHMYGCAEIDRLHVHYLLLQLKPLHWGTFYFTVIIVSRGIVYNTLSAEMVFYM